MADARGSDGSVLDGFVERCRTIVVGDDPVVALTNEMERLVADPSVLRRIIPIPTTRESVAGFEQIVFEDEDLTVFVVHSAPDVVQPPHDHLMSAVIGVYEGSERHRLYRRDAGALVHSGGADVGVGEVLLLGPSAIHAISAPTEWCRAIHLYVGSLTTADRSLFDPDTGAEEPMTADRYAELCRVGAVRFGS